MTYRDRTCSVAIGLLLALAGCGRSDSGDPGLAGAVRDSAGIRIVDHPSIPLRMPTWSIDEHPDVRIGSREGTGADVLGNVADLALLSNGTIVIADAQAMELRAFSSAGEHLWTAGRSGGGPGEFERSISRLALLPGDSLLVTDGGGRALVFGPDGSLARMFSLVSDPNSGIPSMLGTLEDGSVLMQSSVRDPDGGILNGYARAPLLLTLSSSDGQSVRELGVFRGPESRIDVAIDSRGEIASISVRRFSMGRGPVFAAGRDAVIAGETDRYELQRFDLSGTLTTIVRVDLPPPIADDEVRRRAAEGNPDVLLPDTLPMFGSARLDDHGRMWVREFIPEYEERAPIWWVMDGDGGFTARVEVPKDFDPIRFSGENVWGLRFDELGVAYVERRAILKG